MSHIACTYITSITFYRIGENWGDDEIDDGDNVNHEAEMGFQNDAALGALNGFPMHCPWFEQHPNFDWPGHGNGTPISRREDFEKTIFHISLTRSRDANGRIDPKTYARIQDMENRRTCGLGFSFDYCYFLFSAIYIYIHFENLT